jgi:DNA-binding IclR family transcriptional regulator
MTDDTTRDPRSQSPQSVTRVIRILEALCDSPAPLSLADLSRMLASPKSSVAALLRGLSEAGFVTPGDGTWRLGPGAFGLGSALTNARRRLQSSDIIRDGMSRLAERSGETVLFAVADSDGETLTYVDVVESRNAVRFAVSPGDRRPLYCTAGGRVLLAALPETAQADYLKRLKPVRLTSHTAIAKRELAAIIADAQATGVAQTVDQAADGVTGTAAVIRDAEGIVAGALIVAAPSARLEGGRAALVDLVRAEAETISRSLGYRPTAHR